MESLPPYFCAQPGVSLAASISRAMYFTHLQGSTLNGYANTVLNLSTDCPLRPGTIFILHHMAKSTVAVLEEHTEPEFDGALIHRFLAV
jgi:hypothetical protein